MNIRTGISIAGMVALAVGSALYITSLGVDVSAFENPRTATMALPETGGLVIGSRVLLRGVAIGHVTGISPSADHIEVSWDYNRDYEIPQASHYRIDNLSALGETYLAVQPSTEFGPYLGDHATIAPKDVVIPTTIQELSARLTRMLNQLNPDQIVAVLHTVDAALPDDPAVLQNLNTAGSLLAQTMIQHSRNVTELLNSVQSLLQDSGWVGPGLQGTSTDLVLFGQGMVGLLNAAYVDVFQAPLPDGVSHGTGPLIDQLQRFLDKTAGDLNTLAVDVLPAVRAGASAIRTVDVGRLLDNALDSTAAGDSVTVRVDLHGK